MDGALLASIEISKAKAYTARSLNMRPADILPLVQPGAVLYGMDKAHQPPMVVFGGGQPVVRDNTVIGAVGVAGAWCLMTRRSPRRWWKRLFAADPAGVRPRGLVGLMSVDAATVGKQSA